MKRLMPDDSVYCPSTPDDMLVALGSVESDSGMFIKAGSSLIKEKEPAAYPGAGCDVEEEDVMDAVSDSFDRTGSGMEAWNAESEQYLVCVGTKLSHVMAVYDVDANEFAIDVKTRLDPQAGMLRRNIGAYRSTFASCDRKAMVQVLGICSTLNTEVRRLTRTQ